MRYFHLIIITASLLCSCQNQNKQADYQIENLLKQMTLTEKIGQMCSPVGFNMYLRSDSVTVNPDSSFYNITDSMPQGSLYAVLRADPWSQKTLQTGLNPILSAQLLNKMQHYVVENSRLHIPMLFMEECPHGHMAIGTTVFPTGIGLSSTWDKDLLYRVGEVIGSEASVQGASIALGPVLDIAREPRWSRVEETFGEDPYLSGHLGAAMTQGLQQYLPVTLKHFAAYGIPQNGHNGGEAQVGQRKLLTDYIDGFKTAIQEGKARCIMTSYNAIDGIPCTADAWLLNDLLRNTWNFDGLVISDLGSIWGLQSQHHVAADQVEAAALALNAGVDIDLGGNTYGPYLAEALKRGLVTEKTIDIAVRRILKMKFDLGLFDNPYIETNMIDSTINAHQHKQLALQAAKESIILLKNDGTLPLNKNLKHIAVIGPNADNYYNQLGDYTAPQNPAQITTILEGLREVVSDETQIEYVKGCMIRDTQNSDINAAVKAAKKADAVILVIGGSSARDFKTSYKETGAATVNNYLSDMDCGEGYDRSTLDLLGDQETLLNAIHKTGKPLVVVYIEGRPLLKNNASEKANALLTAWYPGQEGGTAIAEVIFGDYNPAGRLSITIPRAVGQIPIYYAQGQQSDYMDNSSKPLYPFGFGMSYTTFAYSNLRISPVENSKNKFDETEPLLLVSCNLSNTGTHDGDEVVQLYVLDEVAPIAVNSKLLKGFERITLKAGQLKEIHFKLTQRDLASLNKDMQWQLDSGKITIMIGASSEDIRLKSEYTIE